MSELGGDLLNNQVDTSLQGSDTEAEYLDHKTYSSKDEAQSVADAKKDALDKSTSSLHVELIGDPYIIAGGTAYLANFRPGIPTKWHITKVTHKFDDSGYQTQFEADTKFDEKGKPGGGDDGGGGGGDGTGGKTGGDTTDNPALGDDLLKNQVDTSLSPKEEFKDSSEDEGTGISPEPGILPGNENPPGN